MVAWLLIVNYTKLISNSERSQQSKDTPSRHVKYFFSKWLRTFLLQTSKYRVVFKIEIMLQLSSPVQYFSLSFIWKSWSDNNLWPKWCSCWFGFVQCLVVYCSYHTLRARTHTHVKLCSNKSGIEVVYALRWSGLATVNEFAVSLISQK